MTREETKKILMVIDVTYPNFHIENLSSTIDAWHLFLEDYSYHDISIALKTYVRTSGTGFAPSVAQLISMIYKAQEANQMSDMEAWALVRKGIRNGIYNAENEFQKLPPIVQRAVGEANMLRHWAMMDSDSIDSVVSSNFMRTFRAKQKSENELERIPMEAKALISSEDHNLLEDRENEECE